MRKSEVNARRLRDQGLLLGNTIAQLAPLSGILASAEMVRHLLRALEHEKTVVRIEPFDKPVLNPSSGSG